MKSYREMGLDRDDLQRAERNWVVREDGNMDTGGRKILDAGTTGDDFGAWWKTLPYEQQIKSIGPVRTRFINDGKLNFSDLVDKKTGKVFTLGELGFTNFGSPSPIDSDPITIATGVTQNVPIDISNAVKGTNPNFGLGTGYANNCQRCVPAYALRRWGYNVEAMPRPAPGKPNVCLGGFECFDNTKVEGILGGGSVLNYSAMEKILKAGQEGDIYGVMWTWQGSSSGHVIACEIVNGQPLFIDPQVGKLVPILNLINLNPQYGFSCYKMEEAKLSQTIDWKSIIKRGKP